MNKLIQKSTSRAFMYPLVCFLFLIKRNVIAKSMDNLLPMQEKEKKNRMFVSQDVIMVRSLLIIILHRRETGRYGVTQNASVILK